MLHRRFFIALALVPVLAVAGQAATNFQDIPPGHWARRAAGVLAEHNIMPGRTPVDFSGDTPLIRYELAWAVSHLYNVDGPPASFIVLSDMPPGHVATLEVQRVIGFSLMTSHKPGHFEGDAPASKKEVIEALDTLFEKDGMQAPGRKTAVVYPDVPPTSELGKAIDRIVNRFGLVDAKPGMDFNPNDSLTRYQFLSMLTRAVRYLQPPVAKELAEPPPTPPPASLPPGASPVPQPSLGPDESPPPASPTPTPVPSGQVLKNRVMARGELLALYGEDLPTDVGFTTQGEQRSFAGNGLPGGGVQAEVWSGPWGLDLDVASYFIGLDVPFNGKTSPVNLLDTLVNVEGLYQVPLTPDAQLAFGLAGTFRETYNLSGTLISALYLTADKTYFGGGPALAFGLRLSPSLALSGNIDAFPEVQTYNLPTGAKSLTRFGVMPRVRVEYGFAGHWLATGGAALLLSSGGGGSQTMVGLSAGVGTGF